MKPRMPNIDVPGDSASRVMARDGRLVAVSMFFAVWCFGFLKDSEKHKLTNTYIIPDESGDEFLWCLTSHLGTVLTTFRGACCDLPANFQKVFEAEV